MREGWTMSQPDHAPESVLVVDDDEHHSQVVNRILSRAAFDVTVVGSGAEAIDALRRRSFDVIVSDIQMPGMSGVELLDEIRNHDLDVPVILITGDPTLETAMAAVSRGALGYLTKPASNELLLGSVQRACKLHRLARVKREALQLLGGANDQAGDRAGLQASLGRALESMWMAFQPIVEPALERIFGYEALMRSDEPSLPHPGAILDAAERLDRLQDVGRRVRALSAAAFASVPGDTALLFINLHTRDLLDAALYDRESPLTRIARRVVLEITERAAIDDVRDIQARVDELRQLGFRIAIDDLGSGYAGLSSFVALRPDVVKLDMSLVRNVHQSEVRQRLVGAMTSVAKEMGMRVIAEGVELLEERDVVHGCGCELMQGYLFAKPGHPFPRVDRTTMSAMRPAHATSPLGGVSVGTKVDGRYELRRELGRGAAGVVFEACHAFSGRDVAIKVVAPDVPPSQLAALRARLMREARALAALRHPGIVQILDGGKLDDGAPFIVMEKLTGRTLQGLLATRTRLPPDAAIAIALQLCGALDAVHRAGVVHRDLNPANILLVRGQDGIERVTVVDFGIAQLREPNEGKLTEVGSIVGTPEYMAPEQLLADGDIDGRADVYSIGVTLFECITGSVPFMGGYAKVLMQVCREDRALSIPSFIEPPLRAILTRALARKREERFASVRDMAIAIRAAFPSASDRTELTEPTANADEKRVNPGVATQRRRTPRAPYVTPLRLTLPDGVIDGRSEDISEGGLLVIAKRSCRTDVRVEVRFAMPMEGRIVGCEAYLRWSRCARPDSPDGPYALGMEFIDPPAALVASIARYVQLMGYTSPADPS
jgi:EAL domain-containing protein (putative c-di-GMP-specific phosphodiesterase class I)/serine/threonine protein kinase/ActR/RegA family two-component response regulator